MTKRVDLQLEGMPTPAVEIYLDKRSKSPSLVVRLEGPNGTISAIDVRDARFKMVGGIGIGSSLGQLRSLHKSLYIGSGEGDFYAIIRDLDISFRLKLSDQTLKRVYANQTTQYNGKDNPLIPDETNITDLYVH